MPAAPPRGTVYGILTSGKEKVLHSFGKGSDGIFPVAALAAIGTTLYGTTAQGGAYSCSDLTGYGTIFSITLGGTENVLQLRLRHGRQFPGGRHCDPSRNALSAASILGV